MLEKTVEPTPYTDDEQQAAFKEDADEPEEGEEEREERERQVRGLITLYGGVSCTRKRAEHIFGISRS